MDDDQARRLQGQLRRFHQRQRREAPVVPGVPRTASRMLGVVARNPSVQPGQIGAELDIAASNVAALLTTLETAGLVERHRDGEDRRRVTVHLTDAGRAAVDQHRAARADWLHTAVEQLLTAEEQDLLVRAGDLLDRIAEQAPTTGGPATKVREPAPEARS